VFGIVPARPAEDLPEPTANEEVIEWLVLTEPTQLAFPTHTAAMAAFFAGARGARPAALIPTEAHSRLTNAPTEHTVANSPTPATSG
jgi:hypothetical protein